MFMRWTERVVVLRAVTQFLLIQDRTADGTNSVQSLHCMHDECETTSRDGPV
jgi:hypothetical protein